MRTILNWTEQIQDRDKADQCVHDVAFKPDGTQMIVAAGSRVLVYSPEEGSLFQPLRAHKDIVYCVSYSRNGKRFASGSKDKHVIIWTSKLEGILKYSHNDAIQCIAYSPTSSMLASCAISDFGLWSPEQKAVQKYKVGSRITSCSWTQDGQLLAMGLYNGNVTIWNRTGSETMQVERPGGSPVWSVCFSPSREEPLNVLCIADWNRILSFYQPNGKQLYKERQLDFDPLCVTYFNKGQYLLVSGSHRQVWLYTREGIKLGQIGGEQDSWVWTCKVRPESNQVVLGCNDGTLAMYQMTFSTVHGLYKERYAYRENMTDVIIQHLLTDQRARIKCRDLVKKIAIFKHRLAVQLPERIIIYELYGGESTDMHYRIKEKINQRVQCNLLVVCSDNVILCQERKLQCLSFKGVCEREWLLESLIRYIKVIGGPPGHEGLLLGLKNGQIVKIFLDNLFPISLMKIGSSVRCLDLSASRNKLAVVDEHNTCYVYDIRSNEQLYQEPNANSVAWNMHYEDMLCCSGNGLLSIKAANFPVHQQKLQGFVVGFSGSKVFCLHVYAMTTIEIPQSASMFQYLEKNMFKEAYKIACLGVTDKDWEILAHAALEGLDFENARKAFIRLKDLRYLELIQQLESRKTGESKSSSTDCLLANIYAYKGLISEAAGLYAKCKQNSKAIEMFTDLCMFDQAQDFIANHGSASSGGGDMNGEVGTENESLNQKALLKRKASWAANTEPRVAIETYLLAGETIKAVEIAGNNGWVDALLDLARQINKADQAAMHLCAVYLKKLGQFSSVADIYQRMGDNMSLACLRVQNKQWEEAFLLAEKFPELRSTIYLPYAQELAEHDRFLEAQDAFQKAGHQQLALTTLKQMTQNAVLESRFDDASYYYWILSNQCLDTLVDSLEAHNMERLQGLHKKYSNFAEMYYTYHTIQRFVNEPFTSYMPEAIFNISRYLYHKLLHEDAPDGISKVVTLYALAKQGRMLGAYKLSRFSYDKLQQLHVPARLWELIDSSTISLRSKPFRDAEELLPLCYRCSTTNPALNSRGNQCINCGQPFVFSFQSFEILPLVEFILEDGLSDEEAVQLIESTVSSTLMTNIHEHEKWSKVEGEGYQVLTLDVSEKPSKKDIDPFNFRMTTFEPGGSEFSPIVVDRQALASMDQSEIIIIRNKKPLRYQYYRNLMQDVSITTCPSCWKLFHADDYELQMLQQGHCPFCRFSVTEIRS